MKRIRQSLLCKCEGNDFNIYCLNCFFEEEEE